jgi:hypothetical protein
VESSVYQIQLDPIWDNETLLLSELTNTQSPGQYLDMQYSQIGWINLRHRKILFGQYAWMYIGYSVPKCSQVGGIFDWQYIILVPYVVWLA